MNLLSGSIYAYFSDSAMQIVDSYRWKLYLVSCIHHGQLLVFRFVLRKKKTKNESQNVASSFHPENKFKPKIALFHFQYPSCSIILQCLEQEKHILRRKLSEAESERDLRVQELESDYNDLRSKLMSQVIEAKKCQKNALKNGVRIEIIFDFIRYNLACSTVIISMVRSDHIFI